MKASRILYCNGNDTREEQTFYRKASPDEHVVIVDRDIETRQTRLGNDKVEIRMGLSDNLHIFTVSEVLLVKHTKYFQVLFRGPWKESKESVAEFPEDDPTIW